MSVRAIWKLAALCLGIFVAWLVLRAPPQPPVTEPRPPARVVLSPAPAAAPDATAALTELATTTMWGPRAVRASATAASAAATEPAWFLSGVYGQAGQRVLVVHYEGQARPALQLRVGDRLPDGARIDAIEIDRVRVRPARAAPGERRLSVRWLPVNRGLPVPDN